MAQQHYWLDDDAAHCIEHLDGLGPSYQSEEPVWHAWESICSLYFPRNLTSPKIPGFTGYSVKRELYRGPENTPGSKIPDVVTTERHRVQTVQMRALGSGQGAQQTHNIRDVLWVEVRISEILF